MGLGGEETTILLVGATGVGKSTLANLIAHGPTLCNADGNSHFDIQPGAMSATQRPKPASRDGFKVIDTVGLFHVEDSSDVALEKLVDALEMACNGIDAIVFLIDNRMRRDIFESFKFVERLIGEEECRRRLIIVQTKTNEYGVSPAAEQERFVNTQIEGSPWFKKMFENYGIVESKRWLLTDAPARSRNQKLEEIYVDVRAEVLQRLLDKVGEINAGKFEPTLVKGIRQKYLSTLRACEELRLEPLDDYDLSIVTQIEQTLHMEYRKALKQVAHFELKKILEENPPWLEETREKVKAITIINIETTHVFAGAMSGMTIGTVTGLIVGPIGAMAGAVMGLSLGAIVGSVVSMLNNALSSAKAKQFAHQACKDRVQLIVQKIESKVNRAATAS